MAGIINGNSKSSTAVDYISDPHSNQDHDVTNNCEECSSIVRFKKEVAFGAICSIVVVTPTDSMLSLALT